MYAHTTIGPLKPSTSRWFASALAAASAEIPGNGSVGFSAKFSDFFMNGSSPDQPQLQSPAKLAHALYSAAAARFHAKPLIPLEPPTSFPLMEKRH